ncbi:COMM domain-containing protein 2 [Poeciliopsis prolifica]|uniref:COMM domain-containing protein 2 n=1 Tax=Poeciliopsis prolifica TaxID=188132 RepID=UPI002414044F|nr:COMM domain-containing protein 2 [Poeciliopsis prolifica]
MLLVLSEDHKEHLSFLTKAEGSVVEEFGRIALEFLRKGANPKIYEGAARKLCVPVGMVQHGVEGLMFLMTESSKHMISEVDFMDSVLALGFGEELNQMLLQLYVQHKHQIRSILSQLLCNQPAYHNLEWRLDVQLASRSVRHQIVPMVTIRLLLTRSSDVGSTQSCMHLQADPSSLLHMISILEAALAAVKTSHARRILRNIK